jgi:hypothetical protein
MSASLFRLLDKGKILKINTIWVLARCTDAGSYTVVMTPPPPDGSNTLTLTPIDPYGGLHFSQMDTSALGIEVVSTDPPVKWQMKITPPHAGNLEKDEVEDVILILGYEWD